MKKISFALFLGVLFSIAVFAQTPISTPPKTDSDDVVKITTSLVQVDAIVTDKEGNQVTSLTAADFEIFQDGKLQKIDSFSYVNTAAPNQAPTVSTSKNNKNIILPPPVRLRPESAARIITFIVDDGNCTASQIGMTASRDALEKFVNEQMLPNDLVAIYRTRAGSSMFQQYTSDKAQLLQAARKIRWYPPLGACNSRGGDIFEAATNDSTLKSSGQGTFEGEDTRKSREAGEDFIRNNQIVGTIGVMNYVVRGLQRIGGRKIIFLLSDGLSLRSRDNRFLSAKDVLRDLTDSANRASVVFNTIDVRGLFSATSINASDDVTADKTGDLVTNRQAEVKNTQDGLFFLADETGGTFYRDSNFLDVPLRRALSLEKGYYLIGYEPEDETFKGKKFHEIEIKVKRPGLRVLSRAGFFGRTDQDTQIKKRTGDSELYEAIVAPLPKAGLNLRLTAFFGNAPAEGNFVRSLVHLDGREITFVDEPNGRIKAVFDVVAVTLNEKNEVVDEFNRTHTFRTEAAALPLIKQNGLIYATDVPVKKAGTYNFRVAVRDASSKQLGSAGQVIQVPDLKRNDLFLSGLSVSATDPNGKFLTPSAVKPENALSLTATTAVPAIRQFKRNTILAYAYTIYNAQIDKTSNQPKLSTQVNLYRDGKLISEGKPQAAQIEKQADMTRINDYGYLRLNPNVQNGDYALQVIVKDLTTNKITSQWIDFEVRQ